MVKNESISHREALPSFGYLPQNHPVHAFYSFDHPFTFMRGMFDRMFALQHEMLRRNPKKSYCKQKHYQIKNRNKKLIIEMIDD